MLFQTGINFIEAKTHRAAYVKSAKYIYDTFLEGDDVPVINPKTGLLLVSEEEAVEYFLELINKVAKKLGLEPIQKDERGQVTLIIRKYDGYYVYLRAGEWYPDVWHLVLGVEEKSYGPNSIGRYVDDDDDINNVDAFVNETKKTIPVLLKDYEELF